jgi:pyruvate/2-oxoglutarate dehydrogenase complex dihydrolipoamide acyltransferase (E2) component
MIEIGMPQMGESLAEGTVVRWLKRPGDHVGRDEPLFEISTDKVDTDVPSPVAGILARILVKEGETVAVGAAVALIDDGQPSEPAAVLPAATATPDPADGPAPTAAKAEQPGGHFRSAHAPALVSFRRRGGSPGTPSGGARDESVAAPVAPIAPRSYSPAVLEAARAGGMSLGALTTLRGSGRGGRITKRDVERFLHSGAGDPQVARGDRPGPSSAPAEYIYRPMEGDQIVPMSPVRRKIAHHMTWSTRISPHATAFAECDMTRASAAVDRERDSFVERTGAPLTYTAIAADALVKTIRDFPAFNASVVDEAVVLKPRVHLGIAVALADRDELVVPVIKDADGLSLAGLARAIADLASRARERRLRPEDVQGGTFTLTNPGIFGGLTGTPILNQPQVAIVGLGAIVKRAVVLDGDRIAPRPIMTAALTFDHRAADGMAAFRFLDRFRLHVEAGPEL